LLGSDSPGFLFGEYDLCKMVVLVYYGRKFDIKMGTLILEKQFKQRGKI